MLKDLQSELSNRKSTGFTRDDFWIWEQQVDHLNTLASDIYIATQASIEPVEPPLQNTPTDVADADNPVAGSKTTAEELVVQPYASVIVTEYVPATKPVLSSVVTPPFQL